MGRGLHGQMHRGRKGKHMVGSTNNSDLKLVFQMFGWNEYLRINNLRGKR